jgi:protein-L-isoaspartate(D-aspartate) O-methyltransferase
MTRLAALGPDARGLGMTSQRARDRLVASLREERTINGTPRQPIRDARVLEAIRTTPRHLFIDEALGSRAYEDGALPIGRGQTISQPWVVARMTEALLEHGVPRTVLELGTGSGYPAAVLSAVVETVYTVERIDELLRAARRRFRKLGIDNVRCRFDDGRMGWPDNAPFDAIIVTAATEALEPALLDQLAPGGTLVAPIGGAGEQQLIRLRRTAEGLVEDRLGAVLFVPLLGGTL